MRPRDAIREALKLKSRGINIHIGLLSMLLKKADPSPRKPRKGQNEPARRDN